MILYVAVVAILNVALGYALAVYLRSAHVNRRTATSHLAPNYEGSGDYGDVIGGCVKVPLDDPLE